MPVVRRIRRRGATITVESNAEILFLPGGSVNNWMAKFTGQLRARTIKNTPTNKRPRWGHYGKPLKSTIVSARPRFWGNGRDKQRVYSAVGATAPHAYYVDQGTGVFAGNGPYEAKVLPPWHRGSPSLYESTWKPGGPGSRQVSPVMIKGQKGQFFFDKSLRETMHHMRLSAFQVPTFPKISDAGNSVATGLENFLGNTPATQAFVASLKEWRSWRDAAWRGQEGPWGNEGLVARRNRRIGAKALALQGKKHAAQRKSQYKIAVSKNAADLRAKADAERLRKAREAKALGKKREAERKAEADRNYRMMSARTKGVAFGKKLVRDGGVTGVSASWTRGSDGQFSGYKVSWTSVSGKQHSKVFAV